MDGVYLVGVLVMRMEKRLLENVFGIMTGYDFEVTVIKSVCIDVFLFVCATHISGKDCISSLLASSSA